VQDHHVGGVPLRAGAGAAWIASRGGYRASGRLEKLAFHYVIGLVGIMILWFGRDISARRNIPSIDLALHPLLSCWSLGHGRSTLVVFSFQISRPAQDVGRASVIIPSLRQTFWETLRIHDP
jgi:hypothetical protein